MASDELIQLELQTISEVCRHWATNGFQGKHRAEWPGKIKLFRDAIYTGQGSGAPEYVPFEFLADDFEVVYTAIRRVREAWPKREDREQDAFDWLKGFKVPYDVGSAKHPRQIWRPFPCPEDGVAVVIDKLEAGCGPPPFEIAAQIVANRFSTPTGPISSSLVRDARKRRRKDGRRKSRPPIRQLTLAERFLLSAFFDLSSASLKGEYFIWQVRILDYFIGRLIPPIAIFYMVKIASFLERRIYMGDYDVEQLNELLSLLCPEGTDGPFSQLLKYCKPLRA